MNLQKRWMVLFLCSMSLTPQIAAIDYRTKAQTICERLRKYPTQQPIPAISDHDEMLEFIKENCLDQKYSSALTRYWVQQLEINSTVRIAELSSMDGYPKKLLRHQMIPDLPYLNEQNIQISLDFYEQKNPNNNGFFILIDQRYKASDADYGLRFAFNDTSPYNRHTKLITRTKKRSPDSASHEKLDAIESFAKLSACNPQETVLETSTAWFSDQKFSHCPGLKKYFCKENFKNCFILNSDQPLVKRVEQFIAFAPGHMITKIIQEEKNFNQIFESTKGVSIPTWSYLLSNILGSALKVGMPPDSLPNLKPAASTPPDPLSEDISWYERGPRHPGILSTLSFQIRRDAYNISSHAKAAKLMDVFLCDKVLGSDQIKAQPSLAVKRSGNPFCYDCHAKLDPVASFLSRWPDFDITHSFIYKSDATIYDAGELYGVRDVGQFGLTRQIVKSRQFDECTIHHAHRFLTGQEMPAQVNPNLVPPFLKLYRESGKNFQHTMLEMAATIFK